MNLLLLHILLLLLTTSTALLPLNLPSIAPSIAALRSTTSTPHDDLTLARFVLAHTKKSTFDLTAATYALATTEQYQSSPLGRSIIEAATTAVSLAFNTPNTPFNNEAILSNAPHYPNKISKFITIDQSTTAFLPSSPPGDLLYVVRAGLIDDAALMDAVTVTELTAFYLYVKEVQFQLTTRASTPTTLAQVTTLNDLSNINLFSSSSFRDVLSTVSKQTSVYYPTMGRATVLANLPRLLQAVVKLFTPIFPPVVRAKLKFVSAEIPQLSDLRGSTFLTTFEEKYLNN